MIGSLGGADAAAALLATGLHESDAVSVLMDIGTNTELIVGNRDRIVAASCPAGPAFEGGGVVCGMPALDGAIERIALNGSGTPKTSVIVLLPPEVRSNVAVPLSSSISELSDPDRAKCPHVPSPVK